MKEFLVFVIRQLVEYPDEIVFRDASDERTFRYKLELNREDVGKIIGRSGHTIQAIRNLLSAAAQRQGKRAQVEIVER